MPDDGVGDDDSESEEGGVEEDGALQAKDESEVQAAWENAEEEVMQEVSGEPEDMPSVKAEAERLAEAQLKDEEERQKKITAPDRPRVRDRRKSP